MEDELNHQQDMPTCRAQQCDIFVVVPSFVRLWKITLFGYDGSRVVVNMTDRDRDREGRTGEADRLFTMTVI